MGQQIGGIFVDAVRTGSFQLLLRVAAHSKPIPNLHALRGEEIQGLSPITMESCGEHLSAGRQGQSVRRRFCGGHIVSGYHRTVEGISKFLSNDQLASVHRWWPGPARADLVKILQQLFRAGLDANLRNHLAEDAGAYLSMV